MAQPQQRWQNADRTAFCSLPSKGLGPVCRHSHAATATKAAQRNAMRSKFSNTRTQVHGADPVLGQGAAAHRVAQQVRACRGTYTDLYRLTTCWQRSGTFHSSFACRRASKHATETFPMKPSFTLLLKRTLTGVRLRSDHRRHDLQLSVCICLQFLKCNLSISKAHFCSRHRSRSCCPAAPAKLCSGTSYCTSLLAGCNNHQLENQSTKCCTVGHMRHAFQIEQAP